MNVLKEIKELEKERSISEGNYIGTANGIEFELRSPTMDDMPRIEEILAAKGYDLSDMTTLPKTEQVMVTFTALCVRWGDLPGVTRDQLGALPMAAFKEVAEAVGHFRAAFDL